MSKEVHENDFSTRVITDECRTTLAGRDGWDNFGFSEIHQNNLKDMQWRVEIMF